jgi:hypothetical protein
MTSEIRSFSKDRALDYPVDVLTCHNTNDHMNNSAGLLLPSPNISHCSQVTLCFSKKNYNHNITYFPEIKYYVLLKALYDVQKICYTIYRVRGHRNPPPSVGKVTEKGHFKDEGEDNIKMELRPRLK